MYELTTIYEVRTVIERGYNPLFLKEFTFDIKLRIEIQREIFGHSILSRGDIPKANERFYRMVWENKPHYCEECGKPLRNYSSIWISHIYSRGSSPEMAHDPRNTNILCDRHHSQWETGDKEQMRIYPGNVKTMETLQYEYNILRYENEKKHVESRE